MTLKNLENQFNGKVKLDGNNLIKELGIKLIFLFPIYVIHQFLIEVKFIFTRFIFKII